MPKGIPKKGYRETKKYVVERKVRSVQEIEVALQERAPALIEQLEKLTRPIVCANCGQVVQVIDKDVAMYLVDHAIGKSKQRQEIDITHKYELTGDQCDALYERARLAHEQVELLGEWKDETDK